MATFYEKYKISIKIFGYGLITSIILSLIEYLYEILIVKEIAFVGLAAFFVFIFVLAISTLASIISWLIIYFRSR